MLLENPTVFAQTNPITKVSNPRDEATSAIRPRCITESAWFVSIFNFRFGSLAVIQTNSSRMTALEWKADIEPGRTSALTNTGRSAALRGPDLNVR